MKLPTTFHALGAPITVEEQDLQGQGLGFWDESTRTIVIEKNQPAMGKLITLVHEAMHVVETMMIENGAIKRRVSHDFITGSAFALATILVHTGAIEGVTPEDWAAFVKEQG